MQHLKTEQDQARHYAEVRNRLWPTKKPTNIAVRKPQDKPIQRYIFPELSTNYTQTYQITMCGIVTHPCVDRSKTTFAELFAWTCRKTGLTKEQILCNRRTAQFVMARRILWNLARELTGLSYPDIGRRTGGRDHTSVMHALTRMTAEEHEALVAEFWATRYR